jgi:hypothetical protein
LKPPRVTVIVFTYNHERWVEEALTSVLSQRAPFPFEVVVLDDASTDGTAAIVQRLAAQSKIPVELRRAPVNRNDNEAFKQALATSRAEYIAVLDGDDAWTSADKLARQVAVLDADAHSSLSFHDARIEYEDGSAPSRTIAPAGLPAVLEAEALFGVGFVAFGTVVFRRAALGTLPPWFDALEIADWAVVLLCAMRGPVAFVPEVMAKFRKHAGGLWTSRQWLDKQQTRIRFYQRLAAALGPPWAENARAVVDSAIDELWLELDRARQRRAFERTPELLRVLARLDPAGIAGKFSLSAIRRPYRRPPLARRLLAAAMRPGVEPALEGFLDAAGPGWCVGWARDARDSARKVSVEFFRGSERLGAAVADRFRPDLVTAGKGDGFCAFAFALPEGLGTFEVSARFAQTGDALPGSPRAATALPHGGLAALDR